MSWTASATSCGSTSRYALGEGVTHVAGGGGASGKAMRGAQLDCRALQRPKVTVCLGDALLDVL